MKISVQHVSTFEHTNWYSHIESLRKIKLYTHGTGIGHLKKHLHQCTTGIKYFPKTCILAWYYY